MKTCIKCGTELADNAVFCSVCGANQNNPGTETTSATQPVVAKEPSPMQTPAGANNSINEIMAKITNLCQGKMNLPAAISAGVLFISLFMPYVTASVLGFSVSVSLIQAWSGKLLFLICLGGIGCSIINQFMKFEFASIGAAGTSFIAFLLSVYSMFSTASQLGDYSSYIHTSIGFWLGILASIAFAVFAIIPAIPDIKALSTPPANKE